MKVEVIEIQFDLSIEVFYNFLTGSNARAPRFYEIVQFFDIQQKVGLDILKVDQFLFSRFLVFVPVIDLKCNQNANNDQYDLSDRVSGVLQELIVISELLTDLSEEWDHRVWC